MMPLMLITDAEMMTAWPLMVRVAVAVAGESAVFGVIASGWMLITWKKPELSQADAQLNGVLYGPLSV